MPENEGRILNDEQMKELDAMLEADAANPAPPEEEPEMEEAEETDEVDVLNENVEELSEGDGEAEDEEAEPDPNAGANPQAPAVQLPEGIADVNQLVAKYNELLARENQRGEQMKELRELNGQLVAIAEAMGYTKDVGSVDLGVDESLADTNPQEYMRQLSRRNTAEMFKPLIEQQQKNLRGKLIDDAWRGFSREHGDVADMMDDIKAVMNENPDLYDSENGLEVAYHLVRSKRYTPEKALMESDDFIGRAAANPKVREKVIADYLKEVARGNETAPVTVGGGGKAAAIGRKSAPKTFEEASKGLRRLMGM